MKIENWRKRKSFCSEEKRREERSEKNVGFWGGFRKLIVAGKHFRFLTNAKSKNKQIILGYIIN